MQVKNEATTVTTKLYEIPENCNFVVAYSGTQENECSPILTDRYFSEFSGILINAPKEVVLSKHASLEDHSANSKGVVNNSLRLMIAGLARFKFSTLGLKGDTGGEVLVVAVNKETAQSYSGRMPKPDFEAPFVSENKSSEPALTEAEKNALLTSHFNLDLVHDLGLPIAEATYSVYATLGACKSNELVIKVKMKPDWQHFSANLRSP